MTKLKLSSELYDKAAVMQAVRAYNQIATISVVSEGRYLVCSFEACEYDQGQTIAEFENYLIDAANSPLP